MEKVKNNITFKYTIGLSLITILILSLQIQIFKLYDLEKIELMKTLLIFSVTIIPLVGLYTVTKVCCRKSYDIKQSHLLTKIFTISIVLTILSAIYLGFKLDMFGNVDDGLLLISEGEAREVTKNYIESYEETPLITFMVIANTKFMLKELMISTLYIGVLILVLVRHWISKNISIEKKEIIKQIKELLIVVSTIIMIEILANVGINIKEGNIPMSMTIRLESKITNREKQQIENKLKEMDEIINYEYIDDSEASSEFKEWFEETFGDVNNMSYEDYKDIFSNKNIERFDLTVHNKNIDSIKEALQGMNGIEEIQGISIEF